MKWRWVLNESSKTVRLESTESGRDTIMDFVRYGMQFAQPRFNVDGIMIKAEELGEVVEGREHHAEWFKFINHPTAKLIAAAPELLKQVEELTKVNKLYKQAIREEFLVNTENYPKEYHRLFADIFNRAERRFEEIVKHSKK